MTEEGSGGEVSRKTEKVQSYILKKLHSRCAFQIYSLNQLQFS